MSKPLDDQILRARTRLLLMATGVLAIATPSACGSDSSIPHDGAAASDGQTGSGGAAGHGGAGGGTHDAASGAGGTMGASDAGIGGAAGDLGGGGGAIVDSGVDVMPETCGPDGQGCARLSVPLVDPQTGTFFGIAMPATDLSGVSAVFRFCLVAALPQGGGWVQPYAQEGIAPYAGQYDVVAFSAIPACPAFLEYAFNFPGAPDPNSDAGSPWFTRVQNLGLKIQSLDGASGSWANPTVVYVDSITLFRRAPDGGAIDGAGASDDGGTPDDAGTSNDGSASDGGDTIPDSGAPGDTDADASGGAGPPLPPLPGPFTFDTSSFPFSASTYNEVPGSAVDWVP
jgi:hypothetical protein